MLLRVSGICRSLGRQSEQGGSFGCWRHGDIGIRAANTGAGLWILKNDVTLYGPSLFTKDQSGPIHDHAATVVPISDLPHNALRSHDNKARPAADTGRAVSSPVD
jgi:hypothetical protein